MVFLAGGMAHTAYGGIGLAVFFGFPIFLGASLFTIAAALIISAITLKQKNNIDVIQWLDIDLSNKNVLIVDEIDDTRTTLEFCVNKLTTDNRLNNYGVFVIHNKLKTKKFKFPDNIFYYSCSNIIDKWVGYPWDIK